MSKSAKPVTVILVFADWCPHCQMFKPEWQKIKAHAPRIGFDTYEINDEQLSSATKDIRDLVQGFPTLLVRQDGNYQVYTGGRDASAVTDYVQRVMNGGGSIRGAKKSQQPAQRGGMCPCAATGGARAASKKAVAKTGAKSGSKRVAKK